MIFPANNQKPRLTSSILTLFIEHNPNYRKSEDSVPSYITIDNVNSPDALPIYSVQADYLGVSSTLIDPELVKLNAAILYINSRLRTANLDHCYIDHHNHGNSSDFYNICIYYAGEVYSLAYQLSQLTNIGVSRFIARLTRSNS